MILSSLVYHKLIKYGKGGVKKGNDRKEKKATRRMHFYKNNNIAAAAGFWSEPGVGVPLASWNAIV